jgi:integrase
MSTQSRTQSAQSRSAQSKPKRSNGQGTIYEIKSGPDAGKWRCAVSVEGGKRRTFFGKTKEEVEAKLIDFQHAKQHNAPLPPPRTLTVESYATDWLEGRRDHVRPSTWAGYRANLVHHIVPSLGKTNLADLQPADVRRLHRESKARKLSARSVRYVHLVLSLCLKQALEDGLVSRNVATLAKPPGAPKATISPFTPAEALKFLEEVKGEPEECLYVTTLGLGLRRGEVLGLRWRDVNWSQRQISICGQLQRVSHGGLVYVETKTSGSTAVLDAPDFVMDALLAQRDRLTFARQVQPDEYVFPGARGEATDPDSVTHGFVRFCDKHNLRRTRFHDLRHATASLLLAKGVPMWQVSKILRHSSLSITSDLYSHLYAETAREAADVMSGFMAQAR